METLALYIKMYVYEANIQININGINNIENVM